MESQSIDLEINKYIIYLHPIDWLENVRCACIVIRHIFSNNLRSPVLSVSSEVFGQTEYEPSRKFEIDIF